MDGFYRILAEALEADRVGPNDVLTDFDEWNSLAVLTIINSVDEQFGVTIESDDLLAVRTAGDLESLVKTRVPSHA